MMLLSRTESDLQNVQHADVLPWLPVYQINGYDLSVYLDIVALV